MNRSFALMIAAVLIVLGMLALGTDGARGDTMALQSISVTEGQYGATGRYYGYEFLLGRTVTVTQLGVFDYNANGILDSGTKDVCIYTAAGALKVSDDVSGDNQSDGFFWATLDTPVVLTAGKYRISTLEEATGEAVARTSTGTWSPDVTYLNNMYSLATDPNPPYITTDPGDTWNQGFFGPNFKYTYDIAPPGSTVTAAAATGNWGDGSSWVGGSIPGSSDKAYINNSESNVTVAASASAYNVDVAAGALTVNASQTLTTTAATVVSGGSLDIYGMVTTPSLQLTGGSITLHGPGLNRIADTTYVSVDGGTLDLGGIASEYVQGLTMTGGTIQNGGIWFNSAAIVLQNGTINANVGFSSYGITVTSNSAANTVILGGSNTVTGATAVKAGTLQITQAAALGSTSAVTVSSGATLALDGSAANMTVSRGITIYGAGVGDAGALRNIAGDNIWSGTVTAGASSIGVDAGSTLTISGVMSGSSTLTKVGDGTLTLSNTNTKSGATVVAAGTLNVTGSLLSTGTVSVSSGARLTGTGSVGNVSGAGLVSPGSSPGILTVAKVDPAAGLDFAFEFTATGSPTYTNPTASVNDVLRITNATTPFVNSMSPTSVADIYLNVASLTSGDTFKGGWYTDKASDFLGSIRSASYNYYVYGDGSGSHALNGVNYYTLAEYAPGGSVTVSTLDSGYFFTGSTNGYVTQFAFTAPSATVTSKATTGTWATGAQWVGEASPGANDRALLNDADSVVSVDDSPSAYSVDIAAGALSVGAGRTLTLTAQAVVSGGTMDLYGKLDTPTIQQSGGTITLHGAGASDLLSDTADLRVSSGTFNFGGGTEAAGTLTVGGGTVQNSGSLTVSGITVSGGAVQNSGTVNTTSLAISGGTVDAGTMNAANLVFDNATLQNGTVAVTSTVTLRGGTINANLNLTGGGPNAITMDSGAGNTLVLGGSNTYTGETKVYAGSTLHLTNGGALGTSSTVRFYGTSSSVRSTLALSGSITVNRLIRLEDNYSVLRSISGNNTLGGQVYTNINEVCVETGSLTLSGGIAYLDWGTSYFKKTGAGTLVLASRVYYSNYTALTIQEGTVRLSGSSRIEDTHRVYVYGSSVFDIGAYSDTIGMVVLYGGSITGTTGTLTGSTYTVQSGTISAKLGGATSTLTKNTTGTVALSGANTYVGATTVSAGTLVIQNNAALGTVAGATSVTAGATLELGGPSALTVAEPITLNGSGVDSHGSLYNAANNNIWSGAVTLGTAASIGVESGTSLSITGAVGGTGLTKLGGGLLDLANAASNYTGTTTVSAGTLRISGPLATASTVSIEDGGVLHVTGSLAAGADITVQDGGILDVTGSVTLNGGTAVDIAEGGLLTGTGTVQLHLIGAGLVSPGNSPGILTASYVDPSTGMDFAFEFTQTGSPDYEYDPLTEDSINDVLRLTAADPFFSQSLNGANVIDVYFNLATLSGGTFRGGFFTDTSSDFIDTIENATYNYYVLGDGNGEAAEFNGLNYYALDEYLPGASAQVSSVDAGYYCSGKTTNGFVTQFTVSGAVPEPAALGLIGLVLLALRRRRSR